jgi:hypothetical protein
MTGSCNVVVFSALAQLAFLQRNISENTRASKRKQYLPIIIIKTVLVKWMMYKHSCVNKLQWLTCVLSTRDINYQFFTKITTVDKEKQQVLLETSACFALLSHCRHYFMQHRNDFIV